jgi:hypothetical protein
MLAERIFWVNLSLKEKKIIGTIKSGGKIY